MGRASGCRTHELMRGNGTSRLYVGNQSLGSAACSSPNPRREESISMAAKKSDRKKSVAGRASGSGASKSSAHSTVGGPARHDPAPMNDALSEKAAGTEAMAASMPFNSLKAGEYGRAALEPQAGDHAFDPNAAATGSTLSEETSSQKVGGGNPQLGFNPAHLPLDRVRVDS